MQHFLQVESAGPASSGHISEILPPTQGGGSSLARGRSNEVGGEGKARREVGRKAPVTLQPRQLASGSPRPVCVGSGLGAGTDRVWK